MTEWFFQIKVRANDKYCEDFFAENWTFPPEFSGKVSADNKKEAKKKIEEEFYREFPLRVLKKDYPNVPYLLKITEINERMGGIIELFDYKSCEICEKEYRVIDSYNLGRGRFVGGKCCSDDCADEYYKRQREESYNNFENHKCPNVIYKITNKNNGKVYIGQTIRSFTLRWWEHFCEWIPNEDICDFKFETIEIIEDKSKLNEREQFYIDKYDSINTGYNKLRAEKEKKNGKN